MLTWILCAALAQTPPDEELLPVDAPATETPAPVDTPTAEGVQPVAGARPIADETSKEAPAEPTAEPAAEPSEAPGEEIAGPQEEQGPAPDPLEKPKRHKLPQNPYAHTDFTAYTLEKREVRIGIASLQYGLTPGVQLSTAPILDLLGILNFGGKARVFRKGKADGALLSNVYFVPLTDLLNKAGVGEGVVGKGSNVTFESRLTWFQVGGRTSLRVANPWSVHLGAAYARVTANGDLDLGQIPELDVPELGTVGGQRVRLIGTLRGEIAQLSFATDYRFNRRDSLIFQFTTPLYLGALGQIDAGDYTKNEAWDGLTFAVGYGQWIPLSDIGISSLAWQFSWRHFELRAGIALPASNPMGWVQAWNLTYRFGGETRSSERDDRRDYRDQKRAQGPEPR